MYAEMYKITKLCSKRWDETINEPSWIKMLVSTLHNNCFRNASFPVHNVQRHEPHRQYATNSLDIIIYMM